MLQHVEDDEPCLRDSLGYRPRPKARGAEEAFHESRLPQAESEEPLSLHGASSYVLAWSGEPAPARFEAACRQPVESPSRGVRLKTGGSRRSRRSLESRDHRRRSASPAALATAVVSGTVTERETATEIANGGIAARPEEPVCGMLATTAPD
ncbi:hypothetical protein AK812_SmicGene24086 [Symbiodinium microadriaticum]|uniref:Uncharacterized protein n=1 Tax=Symbiodinium microadriaticum TaxID=2951 RepID=A0A1Q9DFN2_SYMMI|nr:hypothetical protein AK812_SmicGene24086 [Symbiodinium microadriaticum]